ncbi:MAG: hypothetical protein ACRD0U_18000 [Acidimicrobiales bacterium]
MTVSTCGGTAGAASTAGRTSGSTGWRLRGTLEDGGEKRDGRDDPEVPEIVPGWDTPLGETLSLLRADAFDATAGTRSCRALALDVGGTWLVSIADELVGKASSATVTQIDLPDPGGTVRVSADGPDVATLAAAEASIAREGATGARSSQLGLALLAAGAIACVIALVASEGRLALLGIGLLIVGGWQAWSAVVLTREARGQAAADAAALRQRVDEAARHLRALADQLEAARRGARADHAAMLRRLGHDEPDVEVSEGRG